jgi:hypothetical protein
MKCHCQSTWRSSGFKDLSAKQRSRVVENCEDETYRLRLGDLGSDEFYHVVMIRSDIDVNWTVRIFWTA